MKKQKSDERTAKFIERLGALIIDIFLVSIIVTLISQPFYNNDNENYDKMLKESKEVVDQYTNGKINMKTYMSKVTDISYDIAKETGLTSIISIFVTALYFIVFQFKNSGQTLGKKILKIRVVKDGNGDISINDFMIRSLIINSIVFDIISICVIMFTNKDVYFYSVYIIQIVEYLVLFICAIMVLSRKDKKGIHDLLVNTKVIKEFKEMKA